MPAVHSNKLIVRLLGVMEERKKKITVFSKEAGIPKDRVYKWVQQGNNPKAEDEKKIIAWIDGKSMEKVPMQEQKTPADSEESYRGKYIKQLEKENDYLQRIVETNLTLVLATVRTISIRQRALGEVALNSIEKIEKKTTKATGALVEAVDRRIDQIEREAYARDNVGADM
jgi:DNA-binding phage protein